MRLPFKNSVVFAGIVGKTPELRYIGDGVATISVRIVSKASYKDGQGNWQTVDEWATAVFYRRQAEELQEAGVQKGTFLHVEGRRHTRKWRDGHNHEKTANEIVATDWHIVAIKESQGGDAAALEPAEKSPPATQPLPDPIRARKGLSDLA